MCQKNRKIFFLLSFFGLSFIFCEEDSGIKIKEIKKIEELSDQYADDEDEDSKAELEIESDLEDGFDSNDNDLDDDLEEEDLD